MWALAVQTFSAVAVEAQDLISLWVSLLAEPTIERVTALGSKLAAVFGSSPIDVIDV
jgi:hypothetical protein